MKSTISPPIYCLYEPYDRSWATILTFIQTHANWVIPATFLLAFGESLALVSLVLPATVILAGIGGMISAAGLPLWPIVAAAFFGAVLGDWISYAAGRYFKGAVSSRWPMSRYPSLLPRAEALFKRWGVFGVFIGRFSGPLRSIVPLAAGMGAMPFVPFQIANITSAAVWAVGLMAPGVVVAHVMR